MHQLRARGTTPTVLHPETTTRIMKKLLPLVLLAAGASACSSKPSVDNSVLASGKFDVVVAGAGSGGIAAALEAARLGRTVLLVEETDTLGGQMGAAGVSTMDSGGHGVDTGIYREFDDLMRHHYKVLGKPVGTCGWSTTDHCFEPVVVQQVLATMLSAERKITLLKRTRVAAVRRAGDTITGVLAEEINGASHEITSSIVIDATEWGDLLPLAGIPYRVGNAEGGAAAPSTCVQQSTYVSVLRKYAHGVPRELVLPGPPAGYTPEVRDAFAKVLSPVKDCPSPTSDPAPPCYDWRQGHVRKTPVNWRTYVGYRGLPDSTNPAPYDASAPDEITLTGVNWGNDWDIKAADVESQAARKNNVCEARLQTLRFLYYIQSEVDSSWAVATDQQFDSAYEPDAECSQIAPEFRAITRHFPPIPYVREARRMIGVETLSGADIFRTGTPAVGRKRFANAVAVGDYAVDLHGCRADETLAAPETLADIPAGNPSGPFQVPMGVFIPATVDGFLVAEKNLSTTRLASGATRLQPITMMTGQAVGAIAAKAIAAKKPPRALPAILVQESLAKAGLRIAPQGLSDVTNKQQWAAAQIAAAHEIMVGGSTGNFWPESAVTRADAAVILTTLFGLLPSNPPAPVGDVAPGDSSLVALDAAHAAGLIGDCKGDAFCPVQPFTRADLAAAIARAMAWSLQATLSNSLYSDVPAHQKYWAYDAVQLASEKSVMAGCGGGRFCPDDAVTRGDMAIAVARVLVLRAE
jgi:hypothetical protein